MTIATLTRPGNLPPEPNSFVGRRRDLTELALILGEVKVLTLCGPGGIGKTRLALRLAADLAPRYPDGAWIVDLAAARDPGLLASLVASVLGIDAERDQPLAGTLAAALRPRSMLLILDTCEHLVDACAALVLQLLASCPNLRVISTSREPLRVRGEVTWRVAPLGLPASSLLPVGECGYAALDDRSADSEAIRLFGDRAATARPGFAITEANVFTIMAVCRSLDGMPLAIELAAARLRALSVEQLAAMLADRFVLLAAGERDAPRRQQTLRATVDWSYDLLSDAERTLLRRLSVFAGWNLDMAEQVCAGSTIARADVLDLLTALLDKSLVALDGELNGVARYRLLDTVREYAADQAQAAGELAALRVAHRDCLLAVQERGLELGLASAGTAWRARVATYRRALAEQANFRAALECCAERGDAGKGLRMCVTLRPFWLTGGDAAEGMRWLERLLAIDAEVPAALRSRAMCVCAELAFDRQDYAKAGDFARQSLELSLAGEVGDAAALRIIALCAMMAGDAARAVETADAAVASARAAGDEWEAGVALIVRAGVLAYTGSTAQAERAFLAALTEVGENRSWGRAQVFAGLGRLARAKGDIPAALRYFGDALVIYREVDARSDMAACLASIGRLALAKEDLFLARSSLTESLRLSLAAGQRLAVVRGLEAQSALAAASGDIAVALRLAGASQALGDAIGAKLSAGASGRLAALLDAAAGQLGPARVNALLAQGRKMTADAALRLAVEAAPAGPAAAAGAAGPQSADQVPVPGQTWPAARPGADKPAVRSGSAELTGREREVAALLALGRTNAAIASALSIKPATAARHVANIFGKLGFSSRAQVAAWMAGHEPPGES
jgi:predicted ATPase/DNA-binding CsgD family transcriptional regulator